MSRFGLRTRLGTIRGFSEGIAGGDADAIGFLTAAGITDVTISVAIQNLVISLKSAGIWANCHVIKPFVGGTAAAHKFNLKDPRDLDAAFRSTFSGGVTHSANGVSFNGTNGYGDTKYAPNSNNLTYNDNHIGLYVRNSAGGGASAFYDMGAGDDNAGTGNFALWSRRAADTAAYDAGDGSGNRTLFSNTNAQGFYLGKANSTTGQIYKNGVEQATKALSNLTLSSRNVYYGAYNENNTPSYYIARDIAFLTMGNGLTNQQAEDYYDIIQDFQTELGRQV
jgi:hypothetical protein